MFDPVPFEHPLWVLYSSGTTGLPKGIVQGHGGIVVEHLKALTMHCDLGPGETFFWFTTTGWMMWNFLVSGLLTGSTIVLFDGSPAHPDLSALWELAATEKVTYFGTSAPYVQSCLKAGLRPAEDLDLSGLRAIGSTGSPLSPEGFRWLADAVGQHIQICSVSGGTDLCTAFVGSSPDVPVWLGELSCRALGAAVSAFDETGNQVVEEVGELVVTEPMPSMPVFFWNDPDGSRLREAYFEMYPGVWRHGDWIRITDRGSAVIYGRSDSTLNRGGVRMGTAEFYRVVENLDEVVDSLVIDTSGVGRPEGELLCFVVLAAGCRTGRRGTEAARRPARATVATARAEPVHRDRHRAQDVERQEVRGAGQEDPRGRRRRPRRQPGRPARPGLAAPVRGTGRRMTVSASTGRPATERRWLLRGATTVRVLVWSTRIVGLLTLSSVVFQHKRMRSGLSSWFSVPVQATVAGTTVVVVAGVCLLMLATGLRRRKRRAWQVTVVFSALIAVLHLLAHKGDLAGLTAIVLFVSLVVYRNEFTALPDPATGRWRAVLAFTQLILAGFGVNLLLLLADRKLEQGNPTLLAKVEHAALSMVGVSGPLRFRAEVLDDLTATMGLVFSVGAILLGGYFLLRSAEPKPSLGAEDVRRIRALLDIDPDSLGYFALRRDKSAVFSASGKSAVAYRVLAGVALTSGDPLGDAEAWPGAIDEYLNACAGHAWVPAVLGCSERAATVWSRYGLDVLELGDEAVVNVDEFTLEGRRMRGVRQAVARVRRGDYEAKVHRAPSLSADEHATLTELADSWRGTDSERGFSMALSRLADADDAGCVLVTAEQDGVVRGMLQFVPWGDDGLSLDLMRRDGAVTDNGLNEFMITELLAACPGLGVTRVSLNFAMFRAALERGERIGAGPIARLWAKALHVGSRWWQIESLYRFNAKFAPEWIPRYLVFPAVRDLPRITLAAMEAEGFGGRPPAILRMLRR